MNFANIGWSGLILILVALLLVFGPSKLPEIGKAFGKSLREFRSATQGMMEEGSKATKEDNVQAVHNQQTVNKADSPVVEPIELKASAEDRGQVSNQ
jgi:sec-independent protein translocase protein TatA